MIEVVEAKAYTCDACGARMAGRTVAWLTVHGPASYAEENVVVYEASVAGDYCKDCCERLVSAVCEEIPMFERYGDVPHDERVAAELELMRRHEDAESDG